MATKVENDYPPAHPNDESGLFYFSQFYFCYVRSVTDNVTRKNNVVSKFPIFQPRRRWQLAQLASSNSCSQMSDLASIIERASMIGKSMARRDQLRVYRFY